MRIGLCVSGATPVDELLACARHAEAAGWDSIWLGEDYFYRGGVTMAAAVASATSTIRIGLGIMTPLPRHPALTAMEIAALQELSGGRVLPGIGAGVGHWMRQMGYDYSSPLSVMRQGIGVTRRLLAGETVDEDGSAFTLRRVRLGFPTTPSPLLLGVIGPRALRLSGEVADGTVTSVLGSPGYVRWARERIAEGARAGNRNGAPHLVVAYAFCTLADSMEEARRLVRPAVAEYLAAGGGPNPLTRHAGLPDALIEGLAAEYARGRIAAAQVPDSAIDAVAAAGPPDHCARWIRALGEAGADVVALMPVPQGDAARTVARASAELLPLLQGVGRYGARGGGGAA